jgi:hypothetical protein
LKRVEMVMAPMSTVLMTEVGATRAWQKVVMKMAQTSVELWRDQKALAQN